MRLSTLSLRALLSASCASKLSANLEERSLNATVSAATGASRSSTVTNESTPLFLLAGGLSAAVLSAVLSAVSAPSIGLCPHVRAKLPGHDVAAVIIKDCAEIEPAPAENLDVGKVGLPKLIDGCRFVFELVGGLEHDEGRAGD